jgi:glycosyltransferase involved in cell wall biosynthesis
MGKKNKIRITVIILTYNEEMHIERCISSAKHLTDSIYVIDSYSSDDTVTIARQANAKCYLKKFESHSKQFNWGLEQIDPCDWVIRLDADEYFEPELISSILKGAQQNDKSISGFVFNRRIKFLGKDIFYGGIFPIEVVRMFRYGLGVVEPRLMDEHIVVQGKTNSLSGELIDDNLNSLSWWIDKHNRYSSLEALEMYFSNNKLLIDKDLSGATRKRRLMKAFYQRVPLPFRASLLFVYRYFIRLGFLDGFNGFIFHFFQGHWYRLLVDSKYKLLTEAQLSGDLTSQKFAQLLDIDESLVKSKLCPYEKTSNS